MVSGGPLLEPGEQAAAQSRLGLVLDATSRMAGSLDLRGVAQALAETVVPQFADCATVELVEDILRPGGAGLNAPMRQVALAGTPTEGVAADVHLVPLVARGRVLGRASFTRASGRPPYGAADRALADELAARAALALDNVRLYDEARATAVELQRSLLPANRPNITGVEMAHRYLPGSRDTEVGGDWFDVLPLSCGRVAFVIGDVMGRGLRAAAAMGQLRTAVRTLAVLDLMPDELLAQLDHLAMGTAQVQLATCVYAVFDPVTRELCFATAGHPPPLLRDPDGTARFLPSPSGAPLGVGGVPFEAAPESVQDGSRLLLYTDGLIESRGADLDDGLAALAAAFVAAPTELEGLCDHVLDVLGRAQGHDDDVAMLVAELRGLEPARIVSWRLVGVDTEVAASRVRVREALVNWGLPRLVDTAELLVTELATNALRYGKAPFELQVLLLDDVVTFAVTDADPPLPRFRRSSYDDEGGRGLQLVATLASRWGARATTTGKVVWCELPRTGGAALGR
jgi:serine phosphatase RsbU (regulator of sigma subunit)/anti-sigma regulatory factor (Ser/Thr protein kinase)